MRTWKNRQRPSKASHKKTVSRKQRGGGLLSPGLVKQYLLANPRNGLGIDDRVNNAVSQGDANIYVDDELMDTILKWEKIQSKKQTPLSAKPGAFTSVPPPLAGVDNPMRNLLGTLRPETSPVAKSLLPFRAPGAVPGQQAVGAPVEQANQVADSLLGPGADTRLGTALASANPLARQPAGTSGLVYNLTSQGKTQTVQDCNAQLDELRRELEALKAGLSETRATLKSQEESLGARIAELTGENQKLSETGEAAQQAINALTESGQSAADKLKKASEALAGKGADLENISKQLQTTSAELGNVKTLTASQSEQIGKLQGALEESARNSAKTQEENNAHIAKLLGDHAAELNRLRSEHQAELAKLEGELRSTREAATSVTKGTAEEKKKLSEEIATLTGQIEAQKGEIGALKSSLETAKTSLQQSQAESSRISQDAARAAGEAEAAAAKASAELAQLQAANAELAQQLEAARAAAQAAAEAAAESNEAKNAAEAAVAAANTLAQTARSDSEAAAAEAARAAADSTKSAGEKAEAQAAAEKARAEAEQAAQAAQAAEAAKNDALARSQAAEAARAQAEANLAQLKRSTPRITLIYGDGEGDKVGGGNGRPARMGEELNVRWQKGAEDSSAWVFVMFSGNNPAYTQLILKPGMFSFQSTVGGDIKAVMFDVTVHSQETLGF